MTAPLIGLSGRRYPASRVTGLVAALADAEVDLHFSEYPAAVAAAGGLPVELTRDADPVAIVARLDGLVLTGGADLDPRSYGAEPAPGLGAVEADRDRWELALLHAALDRGVPVLGVCRGVQLLNVAFGGTLVQDLPLGEGRIDHAAWHGDRSCPVHTVAIEAGTVLHGLLGPSVGVNSLHHQAVERVGAGLVVSARAPDGVVEALEVPGRPVLAVQWHPEMLARRPDPTFSWLVAAARR